MTQASPIAAPAAALEGISPPSVPFREALAAWTRIALSSFGGPAGQIAVIHRIVVDEKRWMDEPRFLHALSYCMLLPGPEAQQLATYIGWSLHGTRGGLVAGGLFILPGFLAILGLSVLYVTHRDSAFLTGVFTGLKPAVLAVVLHAVLRFRRTALQRRHARTIAIGAFAAMFLLRAPFPAVVAGAAVLGYVLYRGEMVPHRPHAAVASVHGAPPPTGRFFRTAAAWLALWFAPVALIVALLGSEHVLAREAMFFSKAAVVTFGGAYAVLAYVASQTVDVYGWLTAAQMLDGLGLAESTPGPLIMVVQFVGFLGAYGQPGAMAPITAGILGSLVTTWVTFAPCFLFILAGAPYVEYLRGNRVIGAALAGIMAAVAGVILNLGVWFGAHVLFAAVPVTQYGPLFLLTPEPASFQPAAAAIAMVAALALLRFHVGLLPLFAAAAAVGVALESLL